MVYTYLLLIIVVFCGLRIDLRAAEREEGDLDLEYAFIRGTFSVRSGFSPMLYIDSTYQSKPLYRGISFEELKGSGKNSCVPSKSFIHLLWILFRKIKTRSKSCILSFYKKNQENSLALARQQKQIKELAVEYPAIKDFLGYKDFIELCYEEIIPVSILISNSAVQAEISTKKRSAVKLEKPKESHKKYRNNDDYALSGNKEACCEVGPISMHRVVPQSYNDILEEGLFKSPCTVLTIDQVFGWDKK